MPSIPLLARAKSYYARLPAARAYLERHGLRMTLLRVLDVLVRESALDSVAAANQWLDKARGVNVATDARHFGRPSVAIIGALDLPQCKKYRVMQKIEELAAHGCGTVVSSHFDVPRSFDVLQLATAVIFYRVPDGDVFRGYVEEARRLGLPVFYDIDDPVFCRTIYESNANLKTLAPAERAHLLDDSRRYLAAMQQCDAAILSTPGLALVARTYLEGKPVHVWRNAIDAELLSIGADLRATPTGRRDGSLRIGYMSGSRAHDLDFELIAGALAATLRRFPHVSLTIAGHAGIPDALKPFEARIFVRPFSSYRGYLGAVADTDIVVIPLLADTFNACKSAIRYLEAALLEVPCVISPVGDFLNVARHGETALFAEGEADWAFCLADLIESADRRRRIGQAARTDVLARQTTRAIAETLDPALLDTIKGRAHV
ncbi:glycosyltransferase [Fontimonas sp. SYSU GA230001]|uniref:glycosyltransferase family protein n=1 Tax=Fontimonas sp. SYSU GA230001 TaxID=3142450 RepID=UPI0032B357CD